MRNNLFCHNRSFIFALLLCTCIFSTPTIAASAVKAHYQSVKSNKVVFQVDVGKPAPASLIVIHTHPANNKLISTSPAATKINHKAGVSKWLLKKVKPGVYPFTLSFKNPVSANSIKMTIRHRDPVNGKLTEKVYRP